MPITASCGNCGKTYQAPDRMAGKRVRCKHCGEVFRIDSADAPADLEPGMPDLGELEKSFAGEEMGTSSSTAIGGPKIDSKGKVRIDRAGDVEDLGLSGGAANALRSNYRYRFAGAKQIDQFMPWALVLLTGFVLYRACTTGYAAGEEGPPPIGVAISRMAIILAAYVIIVWPVSHIALRMATTRLRTSLPRAAAWRSFAAFTPVVLMGAGLYVFSGGAVATLIIGLLVGAAIAVGAITLLFRLFPNEIPVAAAYAGAGSVGGSAFAAATIFAINLIGASLAGMDKNPSLFTSPIAVGLKWVDKPVVIAKPTPKPPVKPTDTTVAANPTTTGPTSPEGPAVSVAPSRPESLPTMPIPPSEDGSAPLVKRIEITPVQGGFDQVIVPAIPSGAFGVIRDGNGGVIEAWDAATWTQPTGRAGRGFNRGQGAIAINTGARRVMRIATVPSNRLEEIALGNREVRMPIDIRAGLDPRLLGFVSENEILVRVLNNANAAFERIDIATGRLIDSVSALSIPNADGQPVPLHVDQGTSSVRVLDDRSGVIVAGKDSSNDSQAVLAVYRWSSPNSPTSIRRVPWPNSAHFSPVGLALRHDMKAALLLDAGGEAYLTTWELDAIIDGATLTGQRMPLIDRKIGQFDRLTTGWWSPHESDPLLWLDDNTLLLYGNIVLDAHTGRRLGSLGLQGVSAQYALADDSFLLVQRQGQTNVLLHVIMDRAALETARKK